MIREQKASSGPRPDFSASGTGIQENYDPTPRSRVASREPTLHASSRNNHSLFSFGGYNNTDENSTPTYEFLPSPSFDDLQSSINAASKDFSNDFPPPEPSSTVVTGGKRPVDAMESSNEGRGPAGSRTVSGPRPVRAGSILRRQSLSTRKGSVSSNTSAAPGSMDPPSAPLTTRTRRQSQYPPISGGGGGGIMGPKAPRKSIGPGVTDSDYSRPPQRRRPSLATSTTSHQGLLDNGGVSTRVNIGGTPTYTDGARRLTASRAAKTKSLQPPSRQGQTHLAPNVSTPDHSRSSSLAGRSPGRQNGGGTNTPSSSSKRMSVMPGMPQGNHATGLGARTISPTDARRAKRLSVLQQPPPMPHTPPTAQPDIAIRHSSRSPSMLPRKITTPSSSRTTPDINRKSYSSGISIGSNASYNTSRTSTGSLQPRLSQQLPASSRLPTPKTRNVHSSADNNEEEEVPPVPAIPKAYESPKDSPAEPPFFTKRKSSMPFDASSINSTSTNSLSGRNSIREPVKAEREHKPRQYGPVASNSDDQQTTATPIKKKNLQPLRLPPLNLLPLSIPTAAKIDAMSKEAPFSDGAITPPPRRANAKTPSTPMTASKASFFSRNRTAEKAEKHLRSSSSVHYLRSESSSQLDGSSSESLKQIPKNTREPRQTVSPFVSTSLPKNGGEHMPMSRSKTSSDIATGDSVQESRTARLTGPRAQKLTNAPKADTPSQISSPEEPTTPSSASSLRRKLSLGWKRSTSKSNINVSHAASERGSEYAPPPPKHDNMPPPKLPASATSHSLNNNAVPSPSPSAKSTTYLDSKRRKSSVSGLSVLSGHDRTRSDSWGASGSPMKEQPVENRAERPLPRTTSSTMFKKLTAKASSTNVKATDPWTIDLDRDDLFAEDEMKKLGSKRKETETAAKTLDGLRKRAHPKDRILPTQALHSSNIKLNIYEKGEIVDFQEIYFCGLDDAKKHVGELSEATQNFGYDDERGDYGIVPGDHLLYRYEIIDVLGKGSFGQVVRCIDHKTGTLVAVKIIRNKKRFHQQALVEVNILKKLREWDPKNKHSVITFVQSFYFRGHLCISTELLDMNLYEFIKSNAFRGFSLKLVRRFTKQLLGSLLLLKQHKVIHCDLKPENILLTHPMHSEIKVIDFGSSCFENEKVYTYIQSRFYRSPEVILGMTYGMPIDMWSVGCILAELFTGVPIFPGENENEQLACIMEVFGPPEKHLIEKSSRRKVFFDSLGKPRLNVSSKGKRRRPSSKTLQQVLKCDDEPFIDFLTRCLRWDPERRMKPDEAIRHEFITGQKSSMAPVRTTVRNESPIRRHNTVATPSTSNRPLPEPPVTAFKNLTITSRGSTTSPSKVASAIANAVTTQTGSGQAGIGNVGTTAHAGAASATARRISLANGLNTSVGNTSRRISTGSGMAATGNSGLPRVTTRSVSARQQDMASAGANAAMNKRV